MYAYIFEIKISTMLRNQFTKNSAVYQV